MPIKKGLAAVAAKSVNRIQEKKRIKSNADEDESEDEGVLVSLTATKHIQTAKLHSVLESVNVCGL